MQSALTPQSAPCLARGWTGAGTGRLRPGTACARYQRLTGLILADPRHARNTALRDPVRRHGQRCALSGCGLESFHTSTAPARLSPTPSSTLRRGTTSSYVFVHYTRQAREQPNHPPSESTSSILAPNESQHRTRRRGLVKSCRYGKTLATQSLWSLLVDRSYYNQQIWDAGHVRFVGTDGQGGATKCGRCLEPGISRINRHAFSQDHQQARFRWCPAPCWLRPAGFGRFHPTAIVPYARAELSQHDSGGESVLLQRTRWTAPADAVLGHPPRHRASG
jgi:hypothetical protein